MAGQVNHENVYEALAAVSAEVGAVAKGEVNKGQGFRFRGIDAVVNAVHPVLAAHGVVVVPNALEVHYETVEVGAKRTPMVSCRLRLEVAFYTVGGGRVTATVVAEAMDSGDKATAKAHSVALRTALLQTLMLPTNEPDPDHDVYQRAGELAGEALETEVARLGELVDAATTVDELRALWQPILALPTATREDMQARVLRRRQDVEASA